MAKIDLDYLEDIFDDEYMADDGSDYKNEIEDDGQNSTVFNGESVILPDFVK